MPSPCIYHAMNILHHEFLTMNLLSMNLRRWIYYDELTRNEFSAMNLLRWIYSQWIYNDEFTREEITARNILTMNLPRWIYSRWIYRLPRSRPLISKNEKLVLVFPEKATLTLVFKCQKNYHGNIAFSLVNILTMPYNASYGII